MKNTNKGEALTIALIAGGILWGFITGSLATRDMIREKQEKKADQKIVSVYEVNQ